MIALSGEGYLWVKALHVISIIAWMAGLLYLPRLYVYHTQVETGSATSELFKVMERRLVRAIMTPAMVASWVFGLWMAANLDWSAGWLHAKLALVVAMTVMHVALMQWGRDFAADSNVRSTKFYRVANEIPTLFMLGIVILVILKPF